MEKYGAAGQTTNDNMEHALCMPDTLGYKHTLTICNTHCSSTAIMVKRTHLNVKYIVLFCMKQYP